MPYFARIERNNVKPTGKIAFVRFKQIFGSDLKISFAFFGVYRLRAVAEAVVRARFNLREHDFARLFGY